MFKIDLEIGQKIERYFGQYLKRQGYEVSYAPIDAIEKRFDIVASKGVDVVHYEIKGDFIAKHTNNLFIEYKYNGQPSGITITSARYFVVIDAFGAHQFTSILLRFWLSTYPYKTAIAGDSKKAEGYLLPKRDLYKMGFYSFIPHDLLKSSL